MKDQIKLKNKVLILGSSYNTLKDAPIDNQDYTIIALSGFQNSCVDIYFEMHDRKKWRKGTNEYLYSCKKPVVCQKQYGDLPKSIDFPFTECFQDIQENYYTSSISYILAFVLLYKNVEEIAIYGVDLTDDEEYRNQRPCTEYLLGILQGRGVKLNIPNKSALLKSDHLYGYEKKSDQYISLEYLQARQQQIFNERKDLQFQLKMLEGAARENEQHIANYKKLDRGGSYLE
ncbi:MAG: hypothetical protein JKY89_01330 [Immundisolibacteraceae bacterium]|nr:hypothetical protein [Immundisolibacteraceae bacterium]